ncbi:venom allergen 5-like [Phlebotomus argentipes]|uniref:venom allergen 5-like n=1 Tax=Phlebotomus argentipes TaxID=94469 RepID=UPI002892FFCB|nr:venom allergen 5-like [Phlebotomus argentipes]
MLKIVLLMALSAYVSAQTYDYCLEVGKPNCGSEHIACEPNSFGTPADVTDIQFVPMTDALKARIVAKHNEYRRRVAKGQETGIPAATKMEEMKWDENLAYVASEHAKHGNFTHDKCRSTPDYPYSGQNLAAGTSSRAYSDPGATIDAYIKMWYDEMPIVRDQVPSCVSKFTTSPNCMPAGHFTAVVKDKNKAVGCSAVTYKKGSSYGFLLTCNYPDTNMLNQPTYVSGTSCSACASVGKTCNDGLCA